MFVGKFFPDLLWITDIALTKCGNNAESFFFYFTLLVTSTNLKGVNDLVRVINLVALNAYSCSKHL